MGENINKFRFLIPPILATLFAGIADYEKIRDVLARHSISIGDLNTLLAGSLLILTLGFVIASLSYALVKFFNYDTIILQKTASVKNKFKGNNIDFSRKNEKNQAANAIITWWAIHDEYIRHHVDTRWAMSMANLNCYIGLVLAPFLTLLIPSDISVSFPLLWWITWSIMLCMFGYLTWRSYVSVENITNLLIKNPDLASKKVE